MIFYVIQPFIQQLQLCKSYLKLYQCKLRAMNLLFLKEISLNLLKEIKNLLIYLQNLIGLWVYEEFIEEVYLHGYSHMDHILLSLISHRDDEMKFCYHQLIKNDSS